MLIVSLYSKALWNETYIIIRNELEYSSQNA